jgi:hypothetical protein
MKQFKKRKNQRAAKARKFVERVAFEQTEQFADELYAKARNWLAEHPERKAKPSGFIITIKCRDDGESVSFTTSRGAHGLTISPTDCGRRLASVLMHYVPIERGMARARL